MNLKSLRENYNTLLESFKEVGFTLNESQQNSLDKFMGSLETKINETREEAVKATRKVVQEDLEGKYKEAFESLIDHLNEHYKVASDIQTKVAVLKESENMANAVDQYLEEYLEEVLPKKQIVDYTRLQKLERIHESLKNMLVVTDDSVEQKKEELEESFKGEKKTLEDQIATLKKQLTESKTENVEKKVEKKESTPVVQESAKDFLESKVKDLPAREAELVRESLKDASVAEIKMKFRTVLESVREKVEEECADTKNVEQSLDEELNNIINDNGDSSGKTDDNTEQGSVGADSETGDTSTCGEGCCEDDQKIDESVMMNWIRMATGNLS